MQLTLDRPLKQLRPSTFMKQRDWSQKKKKKVCSIEEDQPFPKIRVEHNLPFEKKKKKNAGFH